MTGDSYSKLEESGLIDEALAKLNPTHPLTAYSKLEEFGLLDGVLESTPEEMSDLLRQRIEEGLVLVKEAIQEQKELVAENAELKQAIRSHRDQRADDRCWMDDLKLYEALGEPIPEDINVVGDTEAMLENCKRFITARCQAGGTWKSYAELQARVKELESDAERYRFLKEHAIGMSMHMDGTATWRIPTMMPGRFKTFDEAVDGAMNAYPKGEHA